MDLSIGEWYLLEQPHGKVKGYCVEDVKGGGIFKFYHIHPWRTNQFVSDKFIIQHTDLPPGIFSNL